MWNKVKTDKKTGKPLSHYGEIGGVYASENGTYWKRNLCGWEQVRSNGRSMYTFDPDRPYMTNYRKSWGRWSHKI